MFYNKVTGVDITRSYLDDLNKRAKKLDLKINLIQSDMRLISFKSSFDSAANLWTSFGYFEKESDNLLVLKRMFRALRPGGKFMLQVINRDWIIKNYTPASWIEIGKLRTFEKRYLEYETSINRSIWHFFKDGQETTLESHIRMYSYHELLAMMKKAGFAEIEGYGSMDDAPISRDRQMMYIIGMRPKK